MKHLRILLVEDDSTDAELAMRWLKEFEVVVAMNAIEALRYLQDGDFDFALVDLHMPGMDGYELIKRMIATKPELPIAAVSGLPYDAIARRSIEAGANIMLEKPLDATLAMRIKNSHRTRQGIESHAARSHWRTTLSGTLAGIAMIACAAFMDAPWEARASLLAAGVAQIAAGWNSADRK